MEILFLIIKISILLFPLWIILILGREKIYHYLGIYKKHFSTTPDSKKLQTLKTHVILKLSQNHKEYLSSHKKLESLPLGTFIQFLQNLSYEDLNKILETKQFSIDSIYKLWYFKKHPFLEDEEWGYGYIQKTSVTLAILSSFNESPHFDNLWRNYEFFDFIESKDE